MMIVGVPNVGKSSFINRLIGKKSAKTGDRPGVTKGKQWVTLENGMQLLDTPGILWPKFEDPKAGLNLAFCGSIKDEILDVLRSMGNLYVVRGNNDKDWAENLRTSLSFTIGGVKFFMVHNKKDVAWELGDTQVVIFGHTHKYFEKMIDGRLWLNPGSCGRSRFGGEVTMAVMTVEDGKYQVEKIILAENSRK